MVNITNGITRIKDFIKRDVSYVTYYSGGSWHRLDAQDLDIKLLSDNRIGFYVEFGSDAPSGITGIRFYGRDGLIWAEAGGINLVKERAAQGFLYLFTIRIVQENE